MDANSVAGTLTMDSYSSLDEWSQALIDRIRQQVDPIDRMFRLMRYLPMQVATAVLASDQKDLFESHRREITAVFLDLRGFTSFSESVEPEEVAELLRSYHKEMGRIIFKYEGTLEHFAGDGIMVFFNDPVAVEDHAERAIAMAVEMREKMKELRRDWLKNGYDLDLGIGLATGFATVGNIGFEGRMSYGAVGSVTNLASRLSDAAKGGQILTNQRTLSRIVDSVETESLGEMRLKGFARAVAAFNIVTLKGVVETNNRLCA